MGRRRKIDRETLFNARPVRNEALAWRTDDAGIVTIQIPRRRSWWARALARVFFVPEHRDLELDRIGSFAWRNCDGVRTVEELGRAISKEFTIDRREAEVSVAAFLQVLLRRRLIGLAVPNKRGK